MFLFAFLLCVCYCKPIFCICKEIFEEYFNFFCAGKNSGNRPHDNGRTSDNNTADKTQKPADAASEKIVCTGKARRSRQHHKHPKLALAKALTKAGYAVVSPDYPVFDNLEQRAAWNETRGADRAAEAIYFAYQFINQAKAGCFSFHLFSFLWNYIINKIFSQ